MRPYVICHMMGTVDGRIKSAHWGLKNASKYFEDQAAKIKVDAWLAGRTTMEEFSSQKPYRRRKGRFNLPKTDFVAEHRGKSFAVAIDPSGKCHWDSKSMPSEHIIEVLTEKVSSEYLDHLRSSGVSYVFGGKTTLNLALVLRKLRKCFNIRRLRIDGGGHVNGSFLKAGLIDEFSLVLSPLADGRTGSPSVFEVSDDSALRKATRFRIRSIRRIDRDFLWIRYVTVKRSK